MSNIIMHLSSNVVNDLSALDLSGDDTPSMGTASNYTVYIRNNGSSPQSNYQVKLMSTDGVELASVAGPTIESGAIVEVEVPWIPTTTGPMTIYAKVVLSTDELAQNDQTDTMDVEVQPEDIQAVVIGTGDVLGQLPIDLRSRRSIFETIYLADELGSMGGTIVSMALYNQFNTAVPGVDFQIYMGNTTLNSLSEGFIPASEMTLVFDGDVDFPAGENTIVIDFHTPYIYSGGNLVVMFYRPFANVPPHSLDYFKCQNVGTDRSRFDASGYRYFDPHCPGEGWLTGQFPQTTFFYHSSLVENDLSIAAISGDFTPSVGEASDYTVRIRNNGTCPQSNYQVKLMGADDTQLAVVDGPAIGSLQSLEVVIPWTPAVAGITNIQGKVEMAGDEVETNNQTRPMQVRVQAQGTEAVTIGAGGEPYPTPLLSEYRTSIYEVIYLADELGFTSGTIDSISIYLERLTSYGTGLHTQVYLGSTDQSDLSGGFIPVNEMTLIFDGVMDYPAGEQTVTFNLPTPYLIAGENLVMAFCRPWDGYHQSSEVFSNSQIVSTSSARSYRSPNPIYDFSQPPEGELVGLIPQTTFYYTPIEIQNDLSALTIIGERHPNVDEASTYTVRIRNNGAVAQNNYTVKIMGPDDVELASVAGPPINSLQSLEVEIPWTPSATGRIDIYGKVELAGDEYNINNCTKALKSFVYPESASALTIGTGHYINNDALPMNVQHSLFETLYFPDEMEGTLGYIAGMQFYNSFLEEISDIPVSVWLGTTTQSDLTSGWIPSTQLTQVFEGSLDFYSGIDVVNILFEQPYLYLDGTNLVMMISKNTDVSYLHHNYLNSQTRDTPCSRRAFSWNNAIDHANPPIADNFPISYYPQTTFRIIPVEVAQISGAVTDANGIPLSEVEVNVNNGQCSTVTNDAGQYQLRNVMVLPETYTISFNKFGYYEHTQTFNLVPDQELAIDASMQLLTKVNVSGTILASDTGAGITDALIILDGYDNYSVNTDQAGEFSIPNVYGDKTYDYSISAPGYATITGQLVLGLENLNLGEITLNELTYAPVDVAASVNADNAVVITWQAADPEAKRPSLVGESKTAPSLMAGGKTVTKATRGFVGYMVYRLRVEQEEDEAAWVTLTPEATQDLSVIDPSWTLLPGGDYRWAVESVYTNGVTSLPSFSNALNWDHPNGTIAGMVRRSDGTPIVGAVVSSGTETATTDSTGTYSLLMPIGIHDVTAAAAGYYTQVRENELVEHDLVTTVDFVLRGTSADDPQIPVVATALNGNYPNPFNPETTISYSVKEPGRVKLEVYNIRGQLVRTLIDEDHATGHYTQVFNAKDNRGRSLSSGVYLIRMVAPDYQRTSKMILMQ
jgi:uncharacterized membrane protein